MQYPGVTYGQLQDRQLILRYVPSNGIKDRAMQSVVRVKTKLPTVTV